MKLNSQRAEAQTEMPNNYKSDTFILNRRDFALPSTLTKVWARNYTHANRPGFGNCAMTDFKKHSRN